MVDPAPLGLTSRLYVLLTKALARIAPLYLRKRLARGKEDAARWREKLGQTAALRPEGRLIWLHAVGVGEVMALRGLIEALGRADPGLNFLVTSSARSSASVFATGLPGRTIHQYLPLDAPPFLARFLDHWRPDLVIWAEQDIWPAAVFATYARGTPQVLVNARMGQESFGKRRRFKGLYRDVLARYEDILAQDAASAVHLASLGAVAPRVMGSLKAAAPVLPAKTAELERMVRMFAGRRVWVAASTHLEDEAVAMAAQAQLFTADPRWLLVLVPRDPNRHLAMELAFARRSTGQVLAGEAVYLADTFGELGLWYRLAQAALIGGGFSKVEGHNPWEPAALGVAVLHGPRVANFAADYATLHGVDAAREVNDSNDLIGDLNAPDLAQVGARAQALQRSAAPLDGLARDLLTRMRDG
ncbi:3-deoxy-D-manno-octulosonic acid transferase [Pseudorhodobacter sp.]|uniref:3-deoxy-D-manno-octulosonic acid transferase n=1 Tax=Pseudorhodobacter sp. TaxID=1934400 RepID=UPI002648D5C8|nr:glycosyltransferase N-terminal domain-containing protein [Pseudorhodobacter sp.]MDN5788417.1 3-deoxy-D-manno-octulosonic acid transferase [Pseudorhodobacter sp.]